MHADAAILYSERKVIERNSYLAMTIESADESTGTFAIGTLNYVETFSF
jgi:hypothetical protein